MRPETGSLEASRSHFQIDAEERQGMRVDEVGRWRDQAQAAKVRAAIKDAVPIGADVAAGRLVVALQANRKLMKGEAKG